MNRFTFLVLCLLVSAGLSAQSENINKNPFRQLGQELPTPNVYRNAAGAPGHQYWQQQADYEMEIRLDDEQQRVYGSSKITYYNNSTDAMDYGRSEACEHLPTLHSILIYTCERSHIHRTR